MEYRITVGRNRFDKEWEVHSLSWERLAERLAQVTRTSETTDEYRRMTKADRLRTKDVGGFVGGPQERDGARNNASIHIRTLVTIDIDGDTKHVPDVGRVTDALDSLGCSYVLHSTHSSLPDQPRLRAVLPLSREVDAEEYTPIALRVAETVGLDVVDPTTCQKARIMFWPSVPGDAEYVFIRRDGGPLDADRVLATYVDWRNAAEWPGLNEGAMRAQRRRHVTGTLTDGRVKDPTQKTGWVGAFCRCFSIGQAIAEFGLPYREAGMNRYTYTGGSTYGGAVVYGGNRFLYSNHGTDPAGGQLCNAFDLVRIHRFGDDDRLRTAETPVSQLPSYRAMTDLCGELDSVRTAHTRMLIEGTGSIPDTMADGMPGNGAETDDLSGIDGISVETDGEDAEDPSTGGNQGNDGEWMAGLDTNGKNILATPNNFDLIFSNDPALRDTMRLDVFSGRRMIKRPVPWDREGQAYPREFSDSDAAQLRLYFSRRWKIHGGADALSAVTDVQMDRDRVHPVREWLAALPEWDGTERADSVFIRYLGAADTALNRAITRKHLCAAVKRVMEPGCKYDQVLILVGPEGTGKSSIIERLAAGWYMDSNIPVGDKDAYQNLVGHWLVEMGELSDYEAKSVAAYKNFISSQVDRYRPAYGRETISVPRQCVFFGTTNEEGFLKGRTGNRRFWVMDCPGNGKALPGIFDGTLDAELPQIWAETLLRFRDGEPLTLPAALDHGMRGVRESHEGALRDANVEIIREFVLMAKPRTWDELSIEQRRAWYRGRMLSDNNLWSGQVPETYLHAHISAKEIALVVFDQKLSAKTRYEDDNIYYLCDHMDCLIKTGKSRRYGKELGVQKSYEVVRDMPDFMD